LEWVVRDFSGPGWENKNWLIIVLIDWLESLNFFFLLRLPHSQWYFLFYGRSYIQRAVLGASFLKQLPDSFCWGLASGSKMSSSASNSLDSPIKIDFCTSRFWWPRYLLELEWVELLWQVAVPRSVRLWGEPPRTVWPSVVEDRKEKSFQYSHVSSSIELQHHLPAQEQHGGIFRFSLRRKNKPGKSWHYQLLGPCLGFDGLARSGVSYPASR
jgi:hypothetical protein